MHLLVKTTEQQSLMSMNIITGHKGHAATYICPVTAVITCNFSDISPFRTNFLSPQHNVDEVDEICDICTLCV